MHLARSLEKLVNNSVVTADWKVAMAVHVHKLRSCPATSNYMPGSLTCVASKLLERLIAEYLLSHCETKGLVKQCATRPLNAVQFARNKQIK